MLSTLAQVSLLALLATDTLCVLQRPGAEQTFQRMIPAMLGGLILFGYICTPPEDEWPEVLAGWVAGYAVWVGSDWWRR